MAQKHCFRFGLLDVFAGRLPKGRVGVWRVANSCVAVAWISARGRMSFNAAITRDSSAA